MTLTATATAAAAAAAEACSFEVVAASLYVQQGPLLVLGKCWVAIGFTGSAEMLPWGHGDPPFALGQARHVT